MAIMVGSGSALSVAANSTSAEQISGTYETVGRPGTFTLIGRSSATGLQVTSNVGGREMANLRDIPYTGTAGGLSAEDHTLYSQLTAAGKSSVKFTNTTGSAITVDQL